MWLLRTHWPWGAEHMYMKYLKTTTAVTADIKNWLGGTVYNLVISGSFKKAIPMTCGCIGCMVTDFGVTHYHLL